MHPATKAFLDQTQEKGLFYSGTRVTAVVPALTLTLARWLCTVQNWHVTCKANMERFKKLHFNSNIARKIKTDVHRTKTQSITQGLAEERNSKQTGARDKHWNPTCPTFSPVFQSLIPNPAKQKNVWGLKTAQKTRSLNLYCCLRDNLLSSRHKRIQNLKHIPPVLTNIYIHRSRLTLLWDFLQQKLQIKWHY